MHILSSEKRYTHFIFPFLRANLSTERQWHSVDKIEKEGN
jgi:hypothetical protein